MSPLEIVLIVIGIVIIIISCVLVDKSSMQEKIETMLPFTYETSLTEEDKKKLIEKIKELISEISEEAVVNTDDTLSRLSNEKIIAVNEFSEQILEKIKQNHEEVVFLYNMLNDKEKDLKATVREIDAFKKKIQEQLETAASPDISYTSTKNTKDHEKITSSSAPVEQQMSIFSGDNSECQPGTNNNSRILALYSEGKSIIEISKILELGQGEVKLVLDLYKSKK